ncbi:hypothetical protein WAJ30_22475, partial [Acinetobacter baumannii]
MMNGKIKRICYPDQGNYGGEKSRPDRGLPASIFLIANHFALLPVVLVPGCEFPPSVFAADFRAVSISA